MGWKDSLAKLGYVHFDRAFWVLFGLAALAAIGTVLGSVSALVMLVLLVVAAGVYKIGEVLRMHELNRQLHALHGGVQSVHTRVGEVGLSVERTHVEHGHALERVHWDIAKKVHEHNEHSEARHRELQKRHDEHVEVLEHHRRSLVAKLGIKRVRKQLEEISEQLSAVQGKLGSKDADHQKAIEMTYRDLARKIFEVENRLNQTAKVLKAAGESAGT